MEKRAVFAVLVVLEGGAFGCSGRGTLHMVPLDVKQIPTNGPLVAMITPDECYYWINDDGKLCVALRQKRHSGLTPLLSHDISLSLVLGEPPAGSTRTYPATRETLRLRTSAGVTQLRAGSLTGGIVVWDYGKRLLRGRFRITVKQQSYSVLTDWTGNARVLLIGEFSARMDRARGEAILRRSEEDGLERGPVPATRPRETVPTSGS